MKKILVFFSCFVLIIPIVLLPSFAEDVPSLAREVGGTLPVTYFPINPIHSDDLMSLTGLSHLDSLSYFIISSSSPITLCSYFTDGTYHVVTSSNNLYCRVAYYDGTYYVDGSSWSGNSGHAEVVSISSDSPINFEFHAGTALVPSSSQVSTFFRSADDNVDVSIGVSSSVSFIGQVLDFLVSTPALLSLVGLSIALFLIVPFSIRKIKDFVKGY